MQRPRVARVTRPAPRNRWQCLAREWAEQVPSVRSFHSRTHRSSARERARPGKTLPRSSGFPVGPDSFHGRRIRRIGLSTVAFTAGSSSPLRRKCRRATCTDDLDNPVFVAIVCKLAATSSRRPSADLLSRYRNTIKADGRRSCPTRSGIRTSTTYSSTDRGGMVASTIAVATMARPFSRYKGTGGTRN